MRRDDKRKTDAMPSTRPTRRQAQDDTTAKRAAQRPGRPRMIPRQSGRSRRPNKPGLLAGGRCVTLTRSLV